MDSLLLKYRSLAAPAKAALWFLICGVLQRGVSVIVTPIFTRIMSVEDYGVYTLFNSWLDILGVFLTLRLSWGAFMQGLVRYDSDRDEYTAALQGLTTLLVLIGVLIYLPFREFINELTGLNTFLMACIFLSSWSNAVFGFWSARQRVEYRYRALVIVTLVVAISTPVAGVVSVLSVEVCKVEVRVFCTVAIEISFYSWMFIHYMKRGRCFFKGKYWKHALKFNIPLIPHYLSSSMLGQAGRVMVGNMVGGAAAAVYGLANSLSGLMGIVNQAILNAMTPWIYQRIKDGEMKELARVSYLMIMLVGVANLILIAFAPEIVWVFAPSDYTDSIWAIPPLAASLYIAFMYNLFAAFEFYYERTTWVAASSIVGAIVTVVFNWFLIPKFGWLAAAWSSLIGYVVYTSLHYIFMRKIQRELMGGLYVYSSRKLAVLLVGFAVFAGTLTALYSLPLVRYLLVLILLVMTCIKRHELIGALRKMGVPHDSNLC